MINCGLLQLKDFSDGRGHLTPIESASDIPFEVRRVYYITGVPGNVVRGCHAHKGLHQVLICMNGSVKVRLKTPFEEEVVTLDRSNYGLLIGNMIWREMFDFEEGTVLVVLASEHYSEDDYMRDYSEYEKLAQKHFARFE